MLTIIFILFAALVCEYVIGVINEPHENEWRAVDCTVVSSVGGTVEYYMECMKLCN